MEGAAAQQWLGHDDDRDIPVVRDTDVVRVDRNDGEALVDSVSSSAFGASDHFGWVACDNRTTRSGVEDPPRGLQDSPQVHQGTGIWVA